MNVVASVAERAIWMVDQVLNRAMAYAWTATLQRQHPAAEDDFGGGDICSPDPIAFGDDDQPLE
jgi:hypothetical protein